VKEPLYRAINANDSKQRIRNEEKEIRDIKVIEIQTMQNDCVIFYLAPA
jgi:hypothetical protein